MSDIQSWLIALGPYVGGAIGAWGAYQAWQARRVAVVAVAKVDAVAEKVEVVHLATNSIVTAALKAKDAEGAARVGEADAVGAERGRKEEIARQGKEET